MWQSWHAQVRPGRGDAWLPYPAALRAWSYCGLHRDLVAGSPIEAAYVASLSAHAGFLRRNLETDVGGNHLIKNLKALAGLAVFFGDERRLGQRAGPADRPAGGAGPAGWWPLRAGARVPLPGPGRPDRRGRAAPVGRPGASPRTAGRDRPDAPLAQLRARPGRPGPPAQRRLPGPPGARCCPAARAALQWIRCWCCPTRASSGPRQAAGACWPTSAHRAPKNCPPTPTRTH